MATVTVCGNIIEGREVMKSADLLYLVLRTVREQMLFDNWFEGLKIITEEECVF